jgi:hypothetical protein
MQAALDQDADHRVAVLTDHINRTASLLEQCAAEPVSVETDGAAGRRLLQSPRRDERFAARAATGSTRST